MLVFLTTHATTMTTALFAITATTGVMMFFHLLTPYVKDLHEWLSLALLAPIAFHIYRNRAPLAGYIKRGALRAPIGVAAAAAAAFLLPAIVSPHAPGDPARRLAMALPHARVADLAPLVRKTPEELTALLASAGMPGAAPDRTLADIAHAAGKTGRDAVRVVASALPAPPAR